MLNNLFFLNILYSWVHKPLCTWSHTFKTNVHWDRVVFKYLNQVVYLFYSGFNELAGNISFIARQRFSLFCILLRQPLSALFCPFPAIQREWGECMYRSKTTSSKRCHYDGEGSVLFMTLSDLCLFHVQIIKGSSEKIDQWVTVHKAQNFRVCLRRERT